MGGGRVRTDYHALMLAPRHGITSKKQRFETRVALVALVQMRP